ncbi:MAG: TIGR04013 family B12-binding domain/radical SAM domain-containing protein [Candidatus Kariarchaeaceae archaeon]|jgi:B12-binding domain/radical SAM domain protein
MDLDGAVLVFPFSKVNANAISVLVASLDIHPVLQELPILFPPLKRIPPTFEAQVRPYTKVILAFSVYTTQINQISQLIQEYREVLTGKKIVVVCGGPHASGDPFSMLHNGADLVCTGEGELVFSEIILQFLKDSGFHDVPGVAFFENGKLIRTERPAPVDLSKFPPFSLKHEIIRPIEITRGCAWKCRFCQIRARGGFPVRHRSVDQILEYVRHTVKYFSERRPDIRFISPNALSYGSEDGKTLNIERVREMLAGIRSIIGEEGKIYFGSFPSEVRPETITVETAELLAEYSNVEKIIVGGQSGSNRVLQAADRGHDVEETERAVKLLIDYGFSVDVDIIFGLPEEEDEDVEMTLKHMERLVDLGASIHSHTFLPLVGTPFANSPPGEINPKYQRLIGMLQKEGSLKGQHLKQELQAQELAQRRTEERVLKRLQVLDSEK